MKKILTFGTFDIFHKGHEFYLSEAKKHGDKLYVVIARDSTVLKVKGKIPRNNQTKRMATVYEYEAVDEARIGEEGDKYKVLEDIKPDIICLGYDQTAFTDKLEEELKKRGINAKIKRITSHYPDKFKSSKL
ncbi:FAD synthase [Candidatus Woesearchaeota archaeon]|nr:FAD synthase [Candidatus Woesearchaeota archaeon]MCF7901649.1 FAD synthase [Candidatus Woesearchaeota archaeon]MCF8014044.1 FAD synthase [Candidatus Woesearchaeota archaeon]